MALFHVLFSLSIAVPILLGVGAVGEANKRSASCDGQVGKNEELVIRTGNEHVSRLKRDTLVDAAGAGPVRMAGLFEMSMKEDNFSLVWDAAEQLEAFVFAFEKFREEFRTNRSESVADHIGYIVLDTHSDPMSAFDTSLYLETHGEYFSILCRERTKLLSSILGSEDGQCSSSDLRTRDGSDAHAHLEGQGTHAHLDDSVVPVVIGPTSEGIANLLYSSTFGAGRMPAINFWSSQASVRRLANAPFTVNITPDHRAYVQVIVDLIKDFGWGRVILVEAIGAVGTSFAEGVSTFEDTLAHQTLRSKRHSSLPQIPPLPCHREKVLFRSDDRQSVEEALCMITHENRQCVGTPIIADKRTNVVVLFAGVQEALKLFQAAEERVSPDELKGLLWIGNQQWGVNNDLIKAYSHVIHSLISVAPALTTPYWNSTTNDFRQHLLTMRADSPRLCRNPYLAKFWSEVAGCRPKTLPGDPTRPECTDSQTLPKESIPALSKAPLIMQSVEIAMLCLTRPECSGFTPARYTPPSNAKNNQESQFGKVPLPGSSSLCNVGEFQGRIEEKNISTVYDCIRTMALLAKQSSTGRPTRERLHNGVSFNVFNFNTQSRRLEVVGHWEKSSRMHCEKENLWFVRGIDWGGGEFSSIEEVNNRTSPLRLQCWANESCPAGQRIAMTIRKLCCVRKCEPCSRGLLYSNEENAEKCLSCDNDTKANETHTGCEPIPIENLEPTRVVRFIIFTLALMVSALLAASLVVYHRHRDTPIVTITNYSYSLAVMSGLLVLLLVAFPNDLRFFGTTASTCRFHKLVWKMTAMFCSCVIFLKIKVVKTWWSALCKRVSPLSALTERSSLTGVLACCVFMLLGILDAALVNAYSYEPVVRAPRLTQRQRLCAKSWKDGMCPLVTIALVAALALGSRKTPGAFQESQLIFFASISQVFLTSFYVLLGSDVIKDPESVMYVEVFFPLARTLAMWGILFLPRLYIMLVRPNHNQMSFADRVGAHSRRANRNRRIPRRRDDDDDNGDQGNGSSGQQGQGGSGTEGSQTGSSGSQQQSYAQHTGTEMSKATMEDEINMSISPKDEFGDRQSNDSASEKDREDERNQDGRGEVVTIQRLSDSAEDSGVPQHDESGPKFSREHSLPIMNGQHTEKPKRSTLPRAGEKQMGSDEMDVIRRLSSQSQSPRGSLKERLSSISLSLSKIAQQRLSGQSFQLLPDCDPNGLDDSISSSTNKSLSNISLASRSSSNTLSLPPIFRLRSNSKSRSKSPSGKLESEVESLLSDVGDVFPETSEHGTVQRQELQHIAQ